LTTTEAKHIHHDEEAVNCDETRTDTEELLSHSEMELAEATENISTLGKLIEEGTALRESQAAAYEKSITKHEAAIDALTEAIKIIGAFHSGGSWVQLQSKVEQVTQNLQNL